MMQQSKEREEAIQLAKIYRENGYSIYWNDATKLGHFFLAEVAAREAAEEEAKNNYKKVCLLMTARTLDYEELKTKFLAAQAEIERLKQTAAMYTRDFVNE